MMMQPSLNNEECKQAVLLHPFLAGVEKGTALSLIKEGHIQQVIAGETFLRSGEKRKGLYLLIEGRAEVYVERESGKQEVLELINRDEVVGLSSVHQLFAESEEASIVNVKALEDTILFLIEFEHLRPFLKEIKDFLLNETAHRLQDVYQSLSHQLKIGERFADRVTVLERMGDFIQRPAVCISSSGSNLEASQIMKREKVGSLIVLEEEKLVGILTERDLVHRALAVNTPLNITVSAVMTPDPPTISIENYYYEGLARLLAGQSKYLPVMNEGKVAGVVTLKDCMRRSNEGALLSYNALEDMNYPLDKLRELSHNLAAFLWKSNTPVFRSLEIMTGIHDRIYKRVLKQAEQEMGSSLSGTYCFYVMGSAGRREQFFMSDQDHFLLFEKQEDARYYSLFSQKITEYLEKAGFKTCDGNMMASNGQWRGTLSHWEEKVRRWMVHSDEETLMAAQNFFAHRLLEGDASLHNLFQRMLAERLQKGKIFLYRLAQNEKAVPQLNSSIRSLLGLNKKELDVKKELLFPLHHSLQILHLAHGGRSGSTLEKLTFLQERNALSQSFLEEVLVAIHDVFKLLIDYKMKHGKAGPIHLQSLSTVQKERLYFSVKKIKAFQKLTLSHFSL